MQEPGQQAGCNAEALQSYTWHCEVHGMKHEHCSSSSFNEQGGHLTDLPAFFGAVSNTSNTLSGIKSHHNPQTQRSTSCLPDAISGSAVVQLPPRIAQASRQGSSQLDGGRVEGVAEGELITRGKSSESRMKNVQHVMRQAPWPRRAHDGGSCRVDEKPARRKP